MKRSIHILTKRKPAIGRVTRHSIFVIAMVLSLIPSERADATEKPYSTIAVIDSVRSADSSLSGKVVYVDFWASWCAPCRASFPWMDRVARKFKEKGFEVVTVNLDRKQEAALKFIEELDVSLEVHFDSTGSLAKMFEIDAMPTSFLYDRTGTLKERHLGFSPNDTTRIVDAIRELLEQKAKK